VVKVPAGSPGYSLTSAFMRIPVSLAGKVTPRLGPPGQFSSARVSSFAAFFHYNRDYNTVRENTHLSTAGRRKIAAQTNGIKDTPPPLRLPLHYLDPRKIVAEAVGKPGTGIPFDAVSPVDTGPGGHGYQAHRGHKTRPYETQDMVNGPGDPRMSSKMDIDLDQLTNRVYGMLERKIKNEKERRGW
jgi:hypothetical protein